MGFHFDSHPWADALGRTLRQTATGAIGALWAESGDKMEAGGAKFTLRRNQPVGPPVFSLTHPGTAVVGVVTPATDDCHTAIR